jgi:hypothetical protein
MWNSGLFVITTRVSAGLGRPTVVTRTDEDEDEDDGGWKREKKNSGFQSPRSPSSAGEAARRRRFFWPSSPSHPSKLYSSLGWLNSKVPKPFFPFILRLIDVDGF